MTSDKSELRRKLLAERSALSETKVAKASQIICDKLISTVNWPSIKTLNIYVSVSGWNEIDTAPIINYTKEYWPKISIICTTADLKQDFPQQKFDIVMVPVLGFDANLNRLGRGGGWYDRFLATQPQALKIGLCFQNGFVEKLPHKSHDIPLDKIITEVQ